MYVCMYTYQGTSLTFQWLRRRIFTVGGPGSIPGRGARIPHALWLGHKKQTNPPPSVWGTFWGEGGGTGGGFRGSFQAWDEVQGATPRPVRSLASHYHPPEPHPLHPQLGPVSGPPAGLSPLPDAEYPTELESWKHQPGRAAESAGGCHSHPVPQNAASGLLSCRLIAGVGGCPAGGFTLHHTMSAPRTLWALSQWGPLGSCTNLLKDGFCCDPYCVSPWVT